MTYIKMYDGGIYLKSAECQKYPDAEVIWEQFSVCSGTVYFGYCFAQCIELTFFFYLFLAGSSVHYCQTMLSYQ